MSKKNSMTHNEWYVNAARDAALLYSAIRHCGNFSKLNERLSDIKESICSRGCTSFYDKSGVFGIQSPLGRVLVRSRAVVRGGATCVDFYFT